MTRLSPDMLLYIAQFVAMSLVAAVLELGFHRSYEASGYTWVVVTWAVAQVGLLARARLHLVPLADGDAQEGALRCWNIVFWSFVASLLPVASWQIAVHHRQIVALMSRRGV